MVPQIIDTQRIRPLIVLPLFISPSSVLPTSVAIIGSIEPSQTPRINRWQSMLQLNRSTQYQKLPEDEALLEDDGSGVVQPRAKKPGNLIENVLKISVTIILICAILDGALLAYFVFRSNVSLRDAYDVRNLESPSSYVRLERLYRHKSAAVAFPPIHNRARYFIQVSSKERTKSHRMWPTVVQSNTDQGFVPNGNNYFQVTGEVSTIVQFRTMDFGMENCGLYFDFPSMPKTATNITRISSSEGETATLDVWALQSDKRLNPRQITWNTKPARREYLGSAQVTFGTRLLFSKFRCESGSYQNFEVGCSSENCNITSTDFEWKKDVFYIIQNQSI